MEKSVFATLAAIDCKEHTEEKNGLTYLSWAWAWAYVKKLYPDANYTVVKFNGLPYVYDPQSGIICYTTVTIQGETHEMWLPVMDGANKALLFVEQKYQAWNRYEKRYEEKVIPAATMFDINKTIMRCLTKNLAMFGLGINIYAGEDLPVVLEEEVPAPAPAPAVQEVVKKSKQKKAEATPGFRPLPEATFKRVVQGYVNGGLAKDGSDYRTAYQKSTGAGKPEMEAFDAAVAELAKQAVQAGEEEA